VAPYHSKLVCVHFPRREEGEERWWCVECVSVYVVWCDGVCVECGVMVCAWSVGYCVECAVKVGGCVFMVNKKKEKIHPTHFPEFPHTASHRIPTHFHPLFPVSMVSGVVSCVCACGWWWWRVCGVVVCVVWWCVW
jgi:hypothetical protein